MRAGRQRIDLVFLVILAVALVLRLRLAATEPYIHDEENTSIPLSNTISFDPDHLHLPLRGENHGALPAYVVKASSTIFGTTPLGYRSLHVILSLCAVVLIYLLTREWWGPVAARWAAALLAFNEYFLGISARATAHVPHLFLVAAALYAFSRFVRSERPAYLYAAGGALGLAFYTKEHSALLLPVFFVTLLTTRYRRWLRSPHVYLACATFLLFIGPDIVRNMTEGPDRQVVSYGNTRNVAQATYADHLQRIGGIGLSPYPSMFYFRGPVRTLYLQVTGRELRDETPEYRSVNPIFGALLFAAVLAATFGRSERDDLRWCLLLLFWGVFGFFTLIRPGNPPGRLDPVSWIWVEATIMPAVMLAGAQLAGVTHTSRIAAWTFGAVAVMYACTRVGMGLLDAGIDNAQEAFAAGSHLLQVAAIDTVAAVRSRPLRAVGLAVAIGFVMGLLVSFGWTWLVRNRGRGGSDSIPQ